MAADAADAAPLLHLLIAGGLLVTALALLVLEFFVVSGGLIALLAALAAAGAIHQAFAVGPLAGWLAVGLTPVLGIAVASWGVRRIQRTRLVVQAEITDDAGYRHRATELGIAVGARGTLVSDARPTGRARFAGGEIDVAVRGPLAAKGAAVEVVAIEGPTVVVSTR